MLKKLHSAHGDGLIDKPLFVATDDKHVQTEALEMASNYTNRELVFNEKALKSGNVCRNFGLKCNSQPTELMF